MGERKFALISGISILILIILAMSFNAVMANSYKIFLPIIFNDKTFDPTPTISPGEIYFLWGFNQSSAPYLVWGADLRDTMKGSCQGFICDGKDLRLYDSSIWKFLGYGDYGKKTFIFEEPFDTFVIHYDHAIGFDALSGITLDGKIVNYGYLTDGTLTASYMDTSNFQFTTIGEAENNGIPVEPPCGIIDPSVDGDRSYSLSNGPGGLVFNFLDRGFYNNPFETRKGYELMSLTIISAPTSEIADNQICP